MKSAEHLWWEQWLNMGCPCCPGGRQGGLPFFPLLPKLPPLSGCLCQIVKDYLGQGCRCNGHLWEGGVPVSVHPWGVRQSVTWVSWVPG